jgi:hypothetical protein
MLEIRVDIDQSFQGRVHLVLQNARKNSLLVIREKFEIHCTPDLLRLPLKIKIDMRE